MIKVIPLKKENLDKIIELSQDFIAQKNFIIYPTDTSYALGVNFEDKKHLEKMFNLKKRPLSKKVSFIPPGKKWLEDNIVLNKRQKFLFNKYLPGEYTFVINAKNDDAKISLRIPDNNLINSLVESINVPLTATSANISGWPDSYSLDDLKVNLLNHVSPKENILVLDGGQLETGKKSTVVDLTKNPPEILREGSGLFSYSHFN